VGFSQEYFNKLLSWAKLEQNEIELNKKPVSLLKLVNSILLFHQKKASKKEIDLVVDIDSGHVAEADEVFLRQAIENLISNAIKFTPLGGSVKCSTEVKNDSPLLIVSDAGIGMPEGVSAEEVFMMRFVPSRRGTNNEKGTGIGLGICKKILDMHGFGISFHRNDAGGTDFVVTMKR